VYTGVTCSGRVMVLLREGLLRTLKHARIEERGHGSQGVQSTWEHAEHSPTMKTGVNTREIHRNRGDVPNKEGYLDDSTYEDDKVQP
jgi:tRNA(Phe) wybutosine-synthesizing methylase Tyw3